MAKDLEKLAKALSWRMEARMSRKRIGVAKLAMLTHQQMKVRKETATRFVTDILNGYVRAYYPCGEAPGKKAYNLAVVLHALGFGENDPLIHRLCREYPGFVYTSKKVVYSIGTPDHNVQSSDGEYRPNTK